jgi:hypothetical protein
MTKPSALVVDEHRGATDGEGFDRRYHRRERSPAVRSAS